ncbi:branched-chain amino acid ABC transporter permease [Actinospongicola halichondriae]|uniref:branched-chain amino acid ABC transporter permease n=1 Tax=Actinospongicola halichondriae TaxID=3236844 RepID=UPI003D3B9D9F
MLDSIAEILIFGIQRGAVFSLVGLGLALVYKSTKVLNFAQGELGTIPAFVAYLVMTGFAHGDDAEVNKGLFVPAALVAIVVGAALGVVLYLVVIRKLGAASAATTLVATAGVALLATSVELNVFEAKVRRFPRPVSGGFRLTGTDVIVEYHTIVILAVLCVVAFALAVFFRSQAGVALLATAQDPYAAELQGVPVERMRALAWGAAGALAGIAGVLGAGVFENLRPGLMTSDFLIPAFIGVVLGGITSMVGAVVGGFLLGIVSAAAIEIVTTFELDVPGPPQLAVMVVLLAVLLLRPRGLFGEAA